MKPGDLVLVTSHPEGRGRPLYIGSVQREGENDIVLLAVEEPIDMSWGPAQGHTYWVGKEHICPVPPPDDRLDSTHPVNINGLLRAVKAEVERQFELWGEQDHPDTTPSDLSMMDSEYWASLANGWKRLNAERVEEGKLAWDGILAEEAYEAMGETDPHRMIVELVQTAAVAISWAQAIRRRMKNDHAPQR